LTDYISIAFIGIYAIFFIIFILLYFGYKRKEYLFYGLYLFFVTFYYFLFTTNAVFASSNVNEGIANLWKELISSFAIIFYAFFSIQLLDLKKYAPKLYRYNLIFIGLNVFGIILYPVLYLLRLPNHQVYYYTTLIFSPISIYLIVLALKLKVPYTKYVLIGTLFTTIGGIISIILSVTVSPNAYFPGQLAMVIDIVLFFYTVQQKIIDLQTENLQLRFKTLTNLQEERQRISLELHDEVGGGLSTIHLLSELTLAGSKNGKNLETISRNSKELVQKMNEIVWALNIKNDNLQGLIGYIRQYVVHTLDEVGIEAKTNVSSNIPEIAIDGRNRREAFLIMKELVNNVIKHSHAKKIQLEMKVDNNSFECSLQDDGVGFDVDAIKANSFGVIGIMDRAAKLKGTINWYKNNGTIVKLRIPLDNFSYKSAIV
jgi:signal transduction histidine kinase